MSFDEKEYLEKLGFPGRFPYTRGVYDTMYHGKPWTIRQYSGASNAVDTNKRFKYLLGQGQTGLSAAFDLPTQMGYDPDDPMAKGEIGKAGVSIAIINDMDDLLKDLQLDKLTLSMTINATAFNLVSFMIAVAKRRGISVEGLGGTVQNDILKEYAARGCYIYPPEPSLRITTDLIEYCAKHMPKWNYISVSGYHIREAGSTAVQEVAFTLSNALCYMEHAIKRGVDKASLARRISFFFNSHNNIIEEVAKFRAARRLWARLAKERLGFPEKLCKLRFHAQTSGVTLASKQPYNNLIRVTYQVLAAALGGAQSIHANAFDEALALPTEQSAKLAIRTQQIIQNEIGIRDVIDPFGGSYAVEEATDRIEEEAMRYICKIDGLGGAVKAIEAKFYQNEIEKEQIAFQRDLESGRKNIVGVTKYTTEESDQTVELFKYNSEMEKGVIERLQRLKKKRDNNKASKCLSKLKKAAEGSENLIPFTVDCCEAGLTLGEISNSLREVFGTFKG